MPVALVYVAGTGRSGSTLVAQLLERTSDAVHAGEVRYLWQRGLIENHLCECGTPFADCPFWTTVVREAYGDAVSDVATRMLRLAARVDRVRRIPQAAGGVGARYRRDRAAYARLLTPLYERIATVAGRSVVLDSSKDPSYLYALDGCPGLEVTPLHLVRDPRAVAYSWTRRRRRPEIHWDVQYMRTVAPTRSARNWLIYNLAIDAFARHRGDRLRYEDFAADPDGQIERLRRALGLPAPTGPPLGHSLSGNPMRFTSAPLVVRPDDEWRAALPARDRRTVTAITSPLLHRYGYPVHLREQAKTTERPPCT